MSSKTPFCRMSRRARSHNESVRVRSAGLAAGTDCWACTLDSITRLHHPSLPILNQLVFKRMLVAAFDAPVLVQPANHPPRAFLPRHCVFESQIVRCRAVIKDIVEL